MSVLKLWVTKPRVLTVVCGLTLIVPAWLGIAIDGVPTLRCPFPMLTIIPAFIFELTAASFCPRFCSLQSVRIYFAAKH